MPSAQQKNEFAARLQSALNKNSTPAKNAADLARLFNVKQSGIGISVQTAYKWLTGRAIPEDGKMKTLAECLDIDSQWLHDGLITHQPYGKAIESE